MQYICKKIKQKKMSLLVVGTVAFDAIETPFGKTDKIVGGAATYIGLSASKFSDNINLVSVVGGDFPSSAIQMLAKHHVNTDGLQIKQNEKTFFWSGRYHDNMNTRDTLDTQLNVLENFNPIVPDQYKDCQILMLGNLMPIIQQQVFDQLKQKPALTVLDTMNFWMDNCMDDLMQALKHVDVLTINDEEARQLSQEYSLVKAAKKIISFGPKTLIIKKGEHGALLFNNDNMFFAPAMPLHEVIDPTGAGDTFAGGFVGYLHNTQDFSFENMKRAIIYGSAMASFCVEKMGTERLANLTQEEVTERMNQFVELSNFDL
jgi:sugar/nucleoside kinase (ribokinase family)